MIANRFSAFTTAIARLAGKPATFLIAFGLILVWAACGPAFGYSEGWQIVINTGTTIVTFLMAFIIQATGNRDVLALQAKLDELIRASEARNSLIGIEQKTEAEIEAQRARNG